MSWKFYDQVYEIFHLYIVMFGGVPAHERVPPLHLEPDVGSEDLVLLVQIDDLLEPEQTEARTPRQVLTLSQT